MRVSATDFKEKAYGISKQETGAVGFDFETTGLNPYKGDHAFIMGWAQGSERHCVMLDPSLCYDLNVFFSNPKLHYCAQNAKFELSFLRKQFGVEVAGTVWDSEVMARVAYQSHIDKTVKFSLQACAERIGLTKHPEALAWLKKNGKKDYSKMPMVEDYVMQDAWLSWELRRQQIETFRHWDTSGEIPIKDVVHLECDVLKPLFDMESVGLLVDIEYCKAALSYEHEQMAAAKTRYQELTGEAFIDSAKSLTPQFDKRGLKYGRTDKGNPSFTYDQLSPLGSDPLVQSILTHRAALKRASTYWENFLYYADGDGIVHPNINQNRAATGRMSITEPACQTWPKDDEDDPADQGPFPIRRAFIARPGRMIVSLDYVQMELYLMTNESGDQQMIDAIQTGTDLHQQTADMAGVRRSLAKNGRFAKLYGAGVKKVAETLGVDMGTSQKICDAIDATAVRTAQYSRELIRDAEKSPYGYNYFGRRYYFERGFTYVFPNYRIQGAGSEILKQAIVKIGHLLKGKESTLLLPVHDELLLDMPKEEVSLIEEIKQIMIGVYPARHLPLKVSVSIGPNMYDLEEYND